MAEANVTEKIGTKTELEIEKITAQELKERDPAVPSYKNKCEYTPAQIDRLKAEILKGYEKLKQEREADGVEKRWDEKEAQYAGEMGDDSGLEFNLSVPVTQIKCDTV